MSHTTISLLLLSLGLLCIAYPLYRVKQIRLPRVPEWKDLQERICDLTRDDVEATAYSELTKQALVIVLTGRRGYGRLSQVPLALDHIQGAAESLARTFRMLGSQAVVIGLLGTVVTFYTFFGTGEVSGGDGAVVMSTVFGLLRPIYLVNGIALAVAIVLFALGLRASRRGDDACLAAAEAFHRLAESGQSDLAPELVKALEVTAGQFQAFSQQLFQDQFSKIESLLGEVQALGTGLRALVEQIVARSSNEQEVYQALLRQNSATVDALTARLDTGFQLLAQPFLEGIPAMQALAESSRELRIVTDQVVQANIVQLSTQLKVTINQLERATKDLPGAVGASVASAVPSLTEASKNGIRLGVEAAVAPLMADVRAALDEGRSQIAETTKVVIDTAARMDTERKAADQQLQHHLDSAVVLPVVGALRGVGQVVKRLDDDMRAFAALLTTQTEPVKQLLDQAPERIGSEVRTVLDQLRRPYSDALEGVRAGVDQLSARTAGLQSVMNDATEQLAKGVALSVDHHEALRGGLNEIRDHLRLTEAEHERLRVAIEQSAEKLAAASKESSEHLLSGLGERVATPIVDSFSVESGRSAESRHQLATAITEKIGAVHGELRSLGGVLTNNQEDRSRAN